MGLFQVPTSFGNQLQQLRILFLGINQLTGPIPASLLNATKLEAIDLARNKFSGKIPDDIGRLQDLFMFHILANQLKASSEDDWIFLDSLTNCTLLQSLLLVVNQLGGTLPSSVANLSTTLESLRIGFNPTVGTIPPGIKSPIKLKTLDMA